MTLSHGLGFFSVLGMRFLCITAWKPRFRDSPAPVTATIEVVSRVARTPGFGVRGFFPGPRKSRGPQCRGSALPPVLG